MYRYSGFFLCIVAFVALSTFADCSGRKTPDVPSYGAKVKFARGQKIEFPDLTVEFLGEKPPRSYEKYPRREFKISRGDEVQEISWGRDQGDIGQVKFQLGGDKFLMELVGSNKFGYLGEDVMVVWKNP